MKQIFLEQVLYLQECQLQQQCKHSRWIMGHQKEKEEDRRDQRTRTVLLKVLLTQLKCDQLRPRLLGVKSRTILNKNVSKPHRKIVRLLHNCIITQVSVLSSKCRHQTTKMLWYLRSIQTWSQTTKTMNKLSRTMRIQNQRTATPSTQLQGVVMKKTNNSPTK